VVRIAYHFSCLNPDCRTTTELPLAIREEIRLRQTSLSTGTASQAILCHVCKHVFAYTLTDVHLAPGPNQDLYLAPNAMSVRRTELECDGEGCESPVEVIAPWLYCLRPEETWPSDDEVARWTMHDAKCGNGHPPKVPLILKKENP
jgi:hypothetical protein